MPPLAHYKLNGEANDAGGYGHHGTPTSIGYAAGKIRQAASFNGSGSKITLPTPIFPANNFSFACWVKPTSLSGNDYITGQFGNFLAYLDDGLWRVRLGSSYFNGQTISTGVWSFLALTYDADTNLTIYTNDQSDYYAGVGVSVSGPVNAALGAYHAGATGTFHGLMDDVRIYDEAPPAWKIEVIRNFGRGSEECEPWQRLIRPVIEPVIR